MIAFRHRRSSVFTLTLSTRSGRLATADLLRDLTRPTGFSVTGIRAWIARLNGGYRLTNALPAFMGFQPHAMRCTLHVLLTGRSLLLLGQLRTGSQSWLQ